MATNQSENKILTTCHCNQWSRGTLTAIPGLQGSHPLLSGDSTLHAKGQKNDQQQAGNFGVHSYLNATEKKAGIRRERKCTKHRKLIGNLKILAYFDRESIKTIIINHKGTRMVKDGVDWNGLQTTNLKNLGQYFQDAQPWRSSCNPRKPNPKLILRVRLLSKVSV